MARYQILSSENWTDPLYQAVSNQQSSAQKILSAIFLAGWFMFSNCDHLSSRLFLTPPELY
jgi:hypothetical protein